MKIEFFPADQRGKTTLEWLDSKHSFSFGEYYNPHSMNFGAVRVLNDDIISPGSGFDMHRHDHMEIVTIVLQGALQHVDSLGNKGVISVGEVQRMSAGTGIMHSEMNASTTDPVHLLQLWIKPKSKLVQPSYEQKHFDLIPNRLTPIVSPNESDGNLFIHQDAVLYLAELEPEKSISYTFSHYRHGVFLFVIDGQVIVEGREMNPGDALGISDAQTFKIESTTDSRILLIDVPME